MKTTKRCFLLRGRVLLRVLSAIQHVHVSCTVAYILLVTAECGGQCINPVLFVRAKSVLHTHTHTYTSRNVSYSAALHTYAHNSTTLHPASQSPQAISLSRDYEIPPTNISQSASSGYVAATVAAAAVHRPIIVNHFTTSLPLITV